MAKYIWSALYFPKKAIWNVRRVVNHFPTYYYYAKTTFFLEWYLFFSKSTRYVVEASNQKKNLDEMFFTKILQKLFFFLEIIVFCLFLFCASTLFFPSVNAWVLYSKNRNHYNSHPPLVRKGPSWSLIFVTFFLELKLSRQK